MPDYPHLPGMDSETFNGPPMEYTDPWDLLTEQAKINNRDEGVEKMLDLLESNKGIMDIRHATTLMDYVELIQKPESLSIFQRVATLIQPFMNELNIRCSFRVTVLETIIKGLENPITNATT